MILAGACGTEVIILAVLVFKWQAKLLPVTGINGFNVPMSWQEGNLAKKYLDKINLLGSRCANTLPKIATT